MTRSTLPIAGKLSRVGACCAFAVVLGCCRASVANSHASDGESHTIVEADSDSAVRGVELGEYRVRSYYPVEAQKSTVCFVLYATVTGDRFAAAQQFAVSHEHKLRDHVITATRLAPLALFDEAELTAFRRRILMRLRRALPELEIDNVYVSDFSLTVKSL